MQLVFLGPPGAGKGTQAKIFAEQQGVSHLSTGDMLRSAVRDATPAGVEAKGYMDRGELVPDELVGRLLEDVLASDRCHDGFLLDGYPRNVAQADTLQAILERLGRSLTSVVSIDVPDEALEARLTGRRSCPNCGSMYHVSNQPPKVDGKCDRCQHDLALRDDDRPKVIRERLQVYHAETRPLLDYYRERKLLLEVDGSVGIDEVQTAIATAVERG